MDSQGDAGRLGRGSVKSQRCILDSGRGSVDSQRGVGSLGRGSVKTQRGILNAGRGSVIPQRFMGQFSFGKSYAMVCHTKEQAKNVDLQTMS